MKQLNLLEVAYHVPVDSFNGNKEYVKETDSFIRSQTFEVTMIKDLQKDPERSTLHIELNGKAPSGAYLMVFPQNDEGLVRELAGFQGYNL